MTFDRLDICEAYYMFHCLWNVSGQTVHPTSGREIHMRLHRMRFKPRYDLELETLTENGRLIYNNLKWLQESTGGKTPTPTWVKHLRVLEGKAAK